MDHVSIEKLIAAKKYRRNQSLHNFIFFFSLLIIFILFCSSPIWFPYIYSSIKALVFVYLPNIKQFIFNPKCLFIVCNVIVVFLIGESKFVGSKESPATEIYDEYVKRSVSLRKVPTVVETRKEESKVSYENKEIVVNMVGHEGEELEQEEEEEDEKLVEEEGFEEVEDEVGLPAEELNQRVEDFIAKINKQRRLEARLY